MSNALLYLSTVLIWGSTWFAITFQLGPVDPTMSVVYRFALAAALLFAFCLFTGKPLQFSAGEHLFMLLQGALLFGVNYVLFYITTQHLTSGLVAVIFSTVILMNIFNGALFLRTPVRGRVMLGAALGLCGVASVFWPELSTFDPSKHGLRGLALGCAATFSASLGNIVSARNQRRGIPVVQANAFGMAYGALLVLAYAFSMGIPFTFDASSAYLASLVYLTVLGSIVAFGCYLTLLGRIGADRAAYATLLFPLVALAISTAFEGYQWAPSGILGMTLVLAGNFLVLRPGASLSRLATRLGHRPAGTQRK